MLVAIVGVGCRGQGPTLREPGPAPSVFIEAPPRISTAELFGALRALAVDVDVGDDSRLRVRMHDAAAFPKACALLGALHHDLETVDLAWLPIADFAPIFNLRSAERLDLRGTDIADLRVLRHLGALRVLSLAETDIESLAPLAELATLERLDLSSARADLRGLASLTGLRHLDLTSARTAPRGFEMRDGEGLDLSALRDLEQLESLRLTATRVRDWAPLRRLWTVKVLDLSYTNFQDLSLLADYADLEALNLRRTAVAELWPLLHLEHLRRVDLRDCELVDPGDVRRLAAIRQDLEILE